MRTLVLSLTLSVMSLSVHSQFISRDFRIDKNYLNLPVTMSQNRQMVHFMIDGDTLTYSTIRLSDNKPDYWVFMDVSAYQGKTMKLIFSETVNGIELIHLDDNFPGSDSLYRESKRPQFHFSSRRGWNNDPNGLVWFDGEYHLFYQHNPYEIHWGNMHWGHAVSEDLIRWTELNDALYPDELGTMFSGSAVIDERNTAGWGTNAMVAAYTADKNGQEVQCLAYSLDRGRTFTKYEGNPILGPQRDPKVIWYRPGQHWVMALYNRAGVDLYTSDNLKEWTHCDYVKGFYECPEIFELPIDGDPENTLWVIYGGSGSYLLGDFDGRNFNPKFGKYRNTYGAHYAAQTYNNTPDGKRIQIGWGRITSPGMPFNQMMCFPTELTLRSTKEGVRMFSEPIEGISTLHRKTYDFSNLNKDQINEKLLDIQHDLLHLKVRMESLDGSQIGISYKGNTYCTMDSDELNRVQTAHQNPDQMMFDVEIIIDRTSMEIFYQKGLAVFVEALKEPASSEGLKLHGLTDQIKISDFLVYELSSIWNP